MAAPDSRLPRQAARYASTALTVFLAAITSTVGAATPAHADQWRDKQWHLDYLNAHQVHKITQGKGVTVAVIDTGVDADHPDLKNNILKGTDLYQGGYGWKDLDGHGTAMASLIAGHGHGPGNHNGILGLAPQAKILPVRTRAGETSADVEDPGSHAADGFNWATSQDAQVINFSAVLGGLRTAVQRALQSDAVVVAAAGNTDQDTSGVQPPANYPGVIAVSGLDRDGAFTNESVQGPEVVLSAPAVDLPNAGSGKRGAYFTATGTSGATALVTATAALVRAKYPDLTAGGVINRLIKTADDKGPPGRDPKYGYGVINPLKALTANIPDVEQNPLLAPSPSPSADSTSAESPTRNDKDGSDLLLILFIAGAVMAFLLVGTGAYFVIRGSRYTRPQGATGTPDPRSRSWPNQTEPSGHHVPHTPPRLGAQGNTYPPNTAPPGPPASPSSPGPPR